MGRQMPWECAVCDGVVDWGDFGPSGGIDESEDRPSCTCCDWIWHESGWKAVTTRTGRAGVRLLHPAPARSRHMCPLPSAGEHPLEVWRCDGCSTNWMSTASTEYPVWRWRHIGRVRSFVAGRRARSVRG